jgi:hypothetical protein
MDMCSYYCILLLQHNLYSIQFDIPWGLKRPERGVSHPHPSNAEVKERVKLYVYFPCVTLWLIIGELCLLRLIKLEKATNITMIFVNEEQLVWLPFNSFLKKVCCICNKYFSHRGHFCNIILTIPKEEICEMNVLLY